MTDIVISEFMDEEAIREGLAGFDVLYDPKLVDDPDRLAGAVRRTAPVMNAFAMSVVPTP